LSEISIRGRITALQVFDGCPNSKDMIHIGITDDQKVYNKIMYFDMTNQPIPFKLGQIVKITISDEDAI